MLEVVVKQTPKPKYLPNKLPLKKPNKGNIIINISINMCKTGQNGIRTHGTIGTIVFKTNALNHSAIYPIKS